MEIYTYSKIDRGALHAKPVQYKITSEGCWECVSHTPRPQGYVMIQIRYRSYLLHRLVYEIEFGEIKEGNVVMHKCDNPACFNPDHLRQGTQAENMADMKRKMRSTKGRSMPKGERSMRAKITDREVWEIKYILNHGGIYTQKELGEIYGVSSGLIGLINTGRARSHVKL